MGWSRYEVHLVCEVCLAAVYDMWCALITSVIEIPDVPPTLYNIFLSPPDVLPTPRPCFSILLRTHVTSTISASSATVSLYTRTRRRSVHCTNSMHAESIRRMNHVYETGTTTATRHAFADTGGYSKRMVLSIVHYGFLVLRWRTRLRR